MTTLVQQQAERSYQRAAQTTAPHVVVLFGAAGDLAKRKLLPGMANLVLSSLAPDIEIVGTSLEELDDESYRAQAKAALDEFDRRTLNDKEWEDFSSKLHYVPSSAGPDALARAVHDAEERLGPDARRIHYLSVPPKAALAAVDTIAAAGLVDGSRIIMEKPFGTDLAAARELNRRLHATFSEQQISRIDHFLGKEPAQNILAIRFGNGLFEPIWNRNFIQQIQIDVPETLG